MAWGAVSCPQRTVNPANKAAILLSALIHIYIYICICQASTSESFDGLGVNIIIYKYI